MNRIDAWQYIGHAVDDALSERHICEVPANARLVGWQCGSEPMFVAVFSYLPRCRVGDEEAVEIATDLLKEKKWFADDNVTEPDYVI